MVCRYEHEHWHCKATVQSPARNSLQRLYSVDESWAGGSAELRGGLKERGQGAVILSQIWVQERDLQVILALIFSKGSGQRVVLAQPS